MCRKLACFVAGWALACNAAFAVPNRRGGDGDGVPAARCKEFQSSVFKPCVCNDDAPREIKYRPAMPECGGDAASVLFGSYASAYSVVLRDNQNRDRWPASGYNGCTAKEVADGLAKCSAFKCQRVRRVNRSSAGVGPQTICCYGEAGRSPIMRGATRMTIKLRNDPNSGNDPLVRVCLQDFSPLKSLN
jgi:hypothetical protein